MSDLMNRTWKIEEIFQEIEGDPSNVRMVIPEEVVEYLELSEHDEIRIRATEDGLIIEKIS